MSERNAVLTRPLVAVVVLLLALASGCVEQVEPAYSIVGRGDDAIAEIRLIDHSSVWCDRAQQVDHGWECWDDEEYRPVGWYERDQVLRVVRVDVDREESDG